MTELGFKSTVCCVGTEEPHLIICVKGGISYCTGIKWKLIVNTGDYSSLSLSASVCVSQNCLASLQVCDSCLQLACAFLCSPIFLKDLHNFHFVVYCCLCVSMSSLTLSHSPYNSLYSVFLSIPLSIFSSLSLIWTLN